MFYLCIFLLRAEKHFANIKYPSKLTVSVIDIFRRIEARKVPTTAESQTESQWQKRVFQILQSWLPTHSLHHTTTLLFMKTRWFTTAFSIIGIFISNYSCVQRMFLDSNSRIKLLSRIKKKESTFSQKIAHMHFIRLFQLYLQNPGSCTANLLLLLYF